jgi:hypothetical protein
VTESNGTRPGTPSKKAAQHYFSAQSYLRYQGSKFVKRFDPNCYISITRKLDTHDVARLRYPSIREALASLPQPALVLGIESDGLFTFAEQEELAEGLPNARLEKISSPEGHDGFLLEFDQVNRHIMGFMREMLPDIMNVESGENEIGELKAVKTSMFGEAEVEVRIPPCVPHVRTLPKLLGLTFSRLGSHFLVKHCVGLPISKGLAFFRDYSTSIHGFLNQIYLVLKVEVNKGRQLQ